MAKRSPTPSEPQSRQFVSTDELDRAIAKLRRRSDQLVSLAGAPYSDPRRETSASDIRATILDIFGPRSPEYLEHQYHQIWDGPEFVGMNDRDLDRGFVAGLVRTKAMLEGLIHRLEEKRADVETEKPRATPSITHANGRIFIGHGGSPLWLSLKDFLVNRLGLEYEEFNRDAAAGLSTKERLENMLRETGFAFLVLTSEDQHADGSHHARENVVHETGLFQGRHGFRRAIVLLEDGCSEFSNMAGITQIRFPKGDILARSEDIRRVLEREGFTNSA
jgi:predicted nucleotide-binding protein